MVQKRCYFQKFLNSVHFLFLLPRFCLWIILYIFFYLTFNHWICIVHSSEWSYLSWSPEFRNLRDVDDQICVLKKQNKTLVFRTCTLLLPSVFCLKQDVKGTTNTLAFCMCDLLCFCMTLLYLINICIYHLLNYSRFSWLVWHCSAYVVFLDVINHWLRVMHPFTTAWPVCDSCVGISVIQSRGCVTSFFTVNFFLFLPHTLLLWKPKMSQPTFIEPLLYSQIYKVSISFHSNVYVQVSMLFPCRWWQGT